MPAKLRKEIEKDPFYSQCIHERFRGDIGKGRLSWEHCFRYSGRQIQEVWSIVPCRMSFNVGVSGRDKDFNRYVALCRATEEDLAKYPKRDWKQEMRRLRQLFSITPEEIKKASENV